MRLGDLDALKEDFKSRLVKCNEWIEKAKDKETKIRASAVKAFIGEVIMTINNAPTVEEKSYAMGYQDGLEDGLDGIRPQGEWLVVGHDDTTYWYRCSICEHEEHDNFTKHYHYCPNCGADMRGGAK